MPADLTTALDQAPALLQGVLIALLLLGLGLWLLGRKLARPAVAVSGLLLGGLGAMVLAQQYDAGQWLLVIVIAGSVVGCLLASLLYRLWMGLTCAAILALAVPMLWLTWQGVTPPADPLLNMSEPPPTEISAETWDRLQNFVRHERQTLERWWNDQGQSRQRTLGLIAGGAGLVGLVGGLIAPNLAAALQTALVGSTLILLAGGSLLRIHLPRQAALIPDTPQPVLIALGLITVAGVLVQWTLWRRKADNG